MSIRSLRSGKLVGYVPQSVPDRADDRHGFLPFTCLLRKARLAPPEFGPYRRPDEVRPILINITAVWLICEQIQLVIFYLSIATVGLRGKCCPQGDFFEY